jgi:Leucine-rich repeat (LRR) protein
VLTENINKLETLWLNESYLYGGWEFVDLTGLQDFVALKDFEVQAAKLPEIDLSGNINLERLFLGSPLIISLDLTVNTKLRNLYVEFAQLSMLDLSNNSELVSVELQLMPLPSLDISMNNKLEMLTIEGGEFKNLTAGEHPVLWHVNISDNKEFAAVDINHFPNVKELILSNNKLTAVDLSVLQDLEILEVQENFLSGLDLSNNESLYYLSAAKNPDLYCIKVSQVHLDRMAEANPFMSWSKDETASYSLECP